MQVRPAVARAPRAIPLLLCLAAFCSPAVADRPGPGGSSQVVARVYYADPEQIRLLTSFDLWEFNDRESKYVLVAVDASEFQAIEALGLRVEIDETRTEELTRPRAVSPTQVRAIPGFPCYRTVEETFDTATDMVAQHPDLASWIDVGDTWEKVNSLGGWDLRVLRLTQSAIAGPKPKLFVTASIHAREYTPAELVTRFAEYLVDGYGVDPDATWILDHHEIHLLLQTNPDGRKKAETGLSWRKNTNRNYCGPTSNNRGADLNRNFSFQWNCCGGSSSSACDPTYHGSFAASEPETQFIQSYMLDEFPDQRGPALTDPAPLDATGLYIDVHSFSELVLWPWGFPGPAPNANQLRTLGRKFAFFNGYTPQQSIDLYATDGTTIDFIYGELGVAGYVFELGTSFFQSCSTFENVILPDNLEALIYAAKVARTPYGAPSGPDVLDLAATPALAELGTSLTLTATLSTMRYENSNGVEPNGPIVAAEYYVDVPPWDTGGGPVAVPMLATDGQFGNKIEGVTAQLDTTGLAGGRHMALVRGKESGGNWGPFTAVFFWVLDGTEGSVAGFVTDSATGFPLQATVRVDSLGAGAPTHPGSGAYDLMLPEGEWTLRATAPGYVDQVIASVAVAESGFTALDFALAPGPRILLVDDDDNGPDVGPTYGNALGALGRAFASWDTGGGGTEPSAAALAPYDAVIWFSGDAGASAGPGGAGESALASWLGSGGCALLSSQDYFHGGSPTPFMQTYLGVSSVSGNVGQTSVTGVGSVFGGQGPYTMSFPYANGSDAVSPAAGAQLAWSGSAGNAGISKDTDLYRTSYLGFGLEAVPAPANREAVLASFLQWCDDLAQLDGDGDGVANGADCGAGDPLLWTPPSPARDLLVRRDGPDNLSWSAPAAPGSGATLYDVLASSAPDDFRAAACVQVGLTATSATDTGAPTPGAASYWLIRSRNGCGESLGADSAGRPRLGAICP